MKPFPLILFLATASVIGQDAPLVTSAAKVKPSRKWEPVNAPITIQFSH